MVKLAGAWDLAWNTPIKEIDLWEMVVREFCIDQLYMTPVSGINNKYVTERINMEDILYENRDLAVVFLYEKADTVLKDFKHPENVLYIFGKVGPTMMPLYRPEQHEAVRIETPAITGLLWGHQCASILLYDRMIKWQ